MCGEDNPSWAGGMVTIECEICGEPFDVIPSRADIARCCSEDCSGRWFSKNHRAQNSPLYRGGESIYHAVKHSLPGPSWITVSKDARDRAGRECEWCGRSKAEVGVSLHAHHIIPILSGGTNRDGNVIVLCPQCHVRAESFTRERIGPVLTDWTDDELPDGRLSSRKYMIQAADMVTSEQATFAAFADD
jgi:5-methylcytosine-specific restriction endonuclease McrA